MEKGCLWACKSRARDCSTGRNGSIDIRSRAWCIHRLKGRVHEISDELDAFSIDSNQIYNKDIGSTTQNSPSTISNTNAANSKFLNESKGGLAQFLIYRACRNDVLANYLYWYLVIECEEYCANKKLFSEDSSSLHPGTNQLHNNVISKEVKMQIMYYNVLQKFKYTLNHGPPEWNNRLIFLQRQTTFVHQLVELIKTVKKESGKRTEKIEKLQALLKSTEHISCDDSKDSFKSRKKLKGSSSEDHVSPLPTKASKFNFMNFEPSLKHPLDPNVVVKGIIPSKATLFKSSLTPARLTFVREDSNQNYVTIFKFGDDLRQDQLILQIITLMDRILKQENLDLKLTPYRVLASSSSHGFVQYIDSSSVGEILLSEGTIQNFFRKCNPSETAPYGIHPEVMDTYVKSCAGYCVVTYLLGVGDRHLDNLLLTKVY